MSISAVKNSCGRFQLVILFIWCFILIILFYTARVANKYTCRATDGMRPPQLMDTYNIIIALSTWNSSSPRSSGNSNHRKSQAQTLLGYALLLCGDNTLAASNRIISKRLSMRQRYLKTGSVKKCTEPRDDCFSMSQAFQNC